MGFLISGKHRAKQFKVVSSRLCWVEIELAPGKASSQQVSLVNAYAPTEARATEEEVEEFYEELSRELVEVRRLVGSINVIVLGDFNVNLAEGSKPPSPSYGIMGGNVQRGEGRHW
jgi:exonuclease III